MDANNTALEARIAALEFTCAAMRQTLDTVTLSMMTAQLLAAERANLAVAEPAAPPAPVTGVAAAAVRMQHEQMLARRRAMYHADGERMRAMKREQRMRAMLRPITIVI